MAAGIGGAFLTAVLSIAQAQDAPPENPAPVSQGRATLAVMPFQATPQITAEYAAEVEVLHDALVRMFVKSNKFEVLERAKIDTVINENNFADSPLVDPANAGQLGKLMGAQYLVVGNLRALGIRTTKQRVPYVNEMQCSERAHLSLELRVIRAETGRVVSAETAGGSNDAPRAVACGGSRQQVLEEILQRSAAGVVAKVVDQVYPLQVVRASADEVILNRGEGAAFRVGTMLDCFAPGEPIIDPDTNEKIGYAETAVGKVTVTQILAKLSKARPDPGGQIANGAVCRMAAVSRTEKRRPAAAKPKVNW